MLHALTLLISLLQKADLISYVFLIIPNSLTGNRRIPAAFSPSFFNFFISAGYSLKPSANKTSKALLEISPLFTSHTYFTLILTLVWIFLGMKLIHHLFYVPNSISATYPGRSSPLSFQSQEYYLP